MCGPPTPSADPGAPCYSVHPSECPLVPGDSPVTPGPGPSPGARSTLQLGRRVRFPAWYISVK